MGAGFPLAQRGWETQAEGIEGVSEDEPGEAEEILP